MDFVLDSHCHTVSSGHAFSTLTENAESAGNKGLKLLAITDHAPALLGGANELYFLNLYILPKKINKVEVIKGVELNILNENGEVDLNEGILEAMECVIASLHTPVFPPQTEEIHTKTLLNLMENKYINIIGHPCDPRYPFDIERIVIAAKKKGIIMEINEKSCNPEMKYRHGTDGLRKMLELCKKYECPVICGSDSHYHGYIGDFTYSKQLVIESEIPQDLVLNTSVELYKKALKNRRSQNE